MSDYTTVKGVFRTVIFCSLSFAVRQSSSPKIGICKHLAPRSSILLRSVLNMRSRILVFHSCTSNGLWSKPLQFSARRVPLCLRIQQRNITADEKPLPEAEQPKGPNQDQLPHVSEEAVATGDITGEGGPDVDQSSPIQEVRAPTESLVISTLANKILNRSCSEMKRARKRHQRSCRNSSRDRHPMEADHIRPQLRGMLKH